MVTRVPSRPRLHACACVLSREGGLCGPQQWRVVSTWSLRDSLVKSTANPYSHSVAEMNSGPYSRCRFRFGLGFPPFRGYCALLCYSSGTDLRVRTRESRFVAWCLSYLRAFFFLFSFFSRSVEFSRLTINTEASQVLILQSRSQHVYRLGGYCNNGYFWREA